MKSFHIILKDHKLGQELGKKNVELAKKFGMDATAFEAIPGNNCLHLFKQHKVRPIQTNKIGHLGCFMSHFLLWKKCIELNETIAILEHDGVFLRRLPDDIEDNFIDVCRLDSCIFWQDSYEADLQQSIDKPITYFKPETVYKEKGFGSYYIGYYGYLIKPCGAEKLIKRAKTIGAHAVDMFVSTDVVDIVSVSSTAVRLDPFCVGKGYSVSTTDDFDKNINR
jgi:GR25 family glycosyltransferase involved in LPS biosynthesis